MSKPRKRPLKTYFKLTMFFIVLIGENYIFTKLFDLTFGKDLWFAVGILVDVLVFAGAFTLLIWWADDSGIFARMMGAKDDDAQFTNYIVNDSIS